MSLEVHIYGPGYGETIFLRWPKDGGGWQGMLVDAHSPQDGRWLAEKLQALELTDEHSVLELALATHPHLDHIYNLAAGLKQAGVNPLHGCYWPGLSATYCQEFFGKLAAQRAGDFPNTAAMVKRWFDYLAQARKKSGTFGYDVGGDSDGLKPFLEWSAGGQTLRVTAIGPWLQGMNRLAKNVSKSIGRNGAIDYQHRHANDVSVALLLEYGEAQIVLGADMEEVNWQELAKLTGRPRFKPSLVKVSHHGSVNGRIDGMWREIGFFDGKGPKPVAIVTPWRQASGNLPADDTVLNEIRRAGFSVFVTGQGPSHRYRNPDSHVVVTIQPDGTTDVRHSRDVRVL